MALTLEQSLALNNICPGVRAAALGTAVRALETAFAPDAVIGLSETGTAAAIRGGTAGGSTAGTGGVGGAVTATGGVGGADSSTGTGGVGGAVSATGGVGGAGQTGGAGGAVTVAGGAAGVGSVTGGAGGAVAVRGGAALIAGAGGAVTIDGGTAVTGNGGNVVIRGGNNTGGVGADGSVLIGQTNTVGVTCYVPLAMNSQKITGIADGTNPQDVASVAQLAAAPTAAALSVLLASHLVAEGASLVGVYDPTDLLGVNPSVEDALLDLAQRRFNINTTATFAEVSAGKTLFAAALIPAGKKLYITNISVQVSGGNAWASGDGATGIVFQDAAVGAVAHVTIGNAGIGAAGVSHHWSAANVTLGAGWYTGGSVLGGLEVQSVGGTHNAGDTLNIKISGYLA